MPVLGQQVREEHFSEGGLIHRLHIEGTHASHVPQPGNRHTRLRYNPQHQRVGSGTEGADDALQSAIVIGICTYFSLW